MVKQAPTSPRRTYNATLVNNTALPFIASPRYYAKKGGPRSGCLWYVRRTDDYNRTRMLGSVYAAHFAQYLKDNPVTVGHNLLGRMATDMDFHDTSAKRGYWIGFFSFLEYLIHAQAAQRPVFTDLEMFQSYMTAQHDWPGDC